MVFFGGGFGAFHSYRRHHRRRSWKFRLAKLPGCMRESIIQLDRAFSISRSRLFPPSGAPQPLYFDLSDLNVQSVTEAGWRYWERKKPDTPHHILFQVPPIFPASFCYQRILLPIYPVIHPYHDSLSAICPTEPRQVIQRRQMLLPFAKFNARGEVTTAPLPLSLHSQLLTSFSGVFKTRPLHHFLRPYD